MSSALGSAVPGQALSPLQLCVTAGTAVLTGALSAAAVSWWLHRSSNTATRSLCRQDSGHSCSTSAPTTGQQQHYLHSVHDAGSQHDAPNVKHRPVSHVPLQSPVNTTKRRNPYDPSPRVASLSWDDYFMALAFLSAERSKDPNKQVGACIVNCDNVILGIGYNGFPRGCPDSALPWAKASYNDTPLETKYPYVVHAEANALLNKNSASVSGARVYVTMFPCNECAKLLIQAGIKEVIYHEAKVSHDHAEAAHSHSSAAADDPFGFSFTPQRTRIVQAATANPASPTAHVAAAAMGTSRFSDTLSSVIDQQVAQRSGESSAEGPEGSSRQHKATSSTAGQGGGIMSLPGAAGAGAGAGNRALSSQDVCYLASQKLLKLAGVRLRQHCLTRAIVLPGSGSAS